MLDVLCGNKNIQRILIFLFVNHKCYGTQLQRSLRVPLTPVQKALHRLETGGLITSYYEGKTRLYQFNPSWPLLPELEHLLKKTYTLLSAQEKKDYHILKEDPMKSRIPQESKTRILMAFWDRLPKVTQLTFHAKTREDTSFNGRGKGEVTVVKQDHNTCLFNEKGSWRNRTGEEMSFTNVFRWTLDRMVGMVSLEHLRRGPDHPVFLVHLAPTSRHTLSSVDSHLCEEDTYFGQMHFDRHSLRLSWRVIGPKKNEEFDYYYS